MNKNANIKSIAIIGSGIAGLGAGFMLNPHYDITVYEKEPTLGGHSRTVEVNGIAVDTGFIVYNEPNYPHLTALFKHLNVETTKSIMSFGASINNGSLEYSTQSPLALFAQKRNLLSPSFWKMLYDIVKFNLRAKSEMTKDLNLTLQGLIDKIGTGEWHKNYFIGAMGAAIWSSPMAKIFDFPARTFVNFFENHGLLTLTRQPQWYTVKGGSSSYVEKLSAPYREKILKNTAAKRVIRDNNHVVIVDSFNQSQRYDAVIFACHADEALKLIENPSYQEQRILGAFKYQANRMVLHHDVSFMPRLKKAWASWVYLSEKKNDATSALALSYWMNNLQPLDTYKPIIVTLNPPREPIEILDEKVFYHPLFDEAAIKAQDMIGSLQGENRSYFCGAYQRYGFHEDGLLSAVWVADILGVKPQWN